MNFYQNSKFIKFRHHNIIMPPKTAASDKGLPVHLRIESAKFRLPNGDRYDGEYLANNKTKTICRQGNSTELVTFNLFMIYAIF